MKKWLFVLFIYQSLSTYGQIITTFAGDGTIGYSGDGVAATSANIGYPDGCVFDKSGNFYFTTVGNERVLKVTPDGIIHTIAGTGTGGYNGDGIAATDAEVNDAAGIAIDSLDNVYIADGQNNRIRKIDAASGIITTIAGNSTAGFGGDNGQATAAILNGPVSVCFDNIGNLYISDFENNRIRKINTSGVISTIAGTSIGGHSGDGGLATAADIEGVGGICLDKIGNLYLAETSDAVVRMIDTSGIITTIAGNGSAGPTGDGAPATAASLALIMLVADDYGNLFISGYIDHDVRVIDKYGIIHTIAGTGVYGFTGDNGQATAAELSSTYGIALDTCGNVYVADKDNIRIRKIALNPECIPAGISTMKNEESISINPNPTYAQLNIDNLKTPTTYCLVSIVGAVMQQGELKEGNNSISIQAIPNGMYLLELTSLSFGEGRGEARTVKKIVKE